MGRSSATTRARSICILRRCPSSLRSRLVIGSRSRLVFWLCSSSCMHRGLIYRSLCVLVIVIRLLLLLLLLSLLLLLLLLLCLHHRITFALASIRRSLPAFCRPWLLLRRSEGAVHRILAHLGAAPLQLVNRPGAGALQQQKTKGAHSW